MVVLWREILKWLAVCVLSALLVVGGTIAGWRIAHGVKEETAIGRVQIEVRPSLGGDVEAFIPVADWGVRANAFDAPIRLHAELRSINRAALLQAANGDPSVAQATESDLKAAARAAIIHAVIWGSVTVILLLVVASLLWRNLRPRGSILIIGVVFMVLLYGGSALRLKSTFDARSFETPTYYAQGSEIGQILDLATETRIQSQYGADYSSIVKSISTVLGIGRKPETSGKTFYAGSDLHGNALVINPVSELIGDNPLLLPGDFGQRGGKTETRLLAGRIAALANTEVAISGNHDTAMMMQGLADRGVTVLGQHGQLNDRGRYVPPPVIRVKGITVAGYRDPLEYGGDNPDGPDRPITVSDLPNPDSALARWQRSLLKWFVSLPDKPAVVMVHQNGLAQVLAQQLITIGYKGPLTIVTGHDHKQHVDRYGRINVVDGGTLGAGGIFGAGRDSIGIARLSFTDAMVLDSVDLIAVEPVSGEAKATRVVIDSMCPGEEHCRVGADDSSPDLSG